MNILDHHRVPAATTDPIEDGLVDPIDLPPGQQLDASVSREQLLQMARDQIEYQFDSQAHDDRATFHAHGEKVCASGCAASRHPTEPLAFWKYAKLLDAYAQEPFPGGTVNSLSDSHYQIGPNAGPAGESTGIEGREEDALSALDELIYFGRQTREMMMTHGTFDLDEQRADYLKQQLRHTHALLEIRVVDEHGVVRTWLPETRVPFDRRHVFDMEENDLQPLVTSGTVKRVGLDYLWVRL